LNDVGSQRILLPLFVFFRSGAEEGVCAAAAASGLFPMSAAGLQGSATTAGILVGPRSSQGVENFRMVHAP